MRTLNAVPAVCVPMTPPPCASAANFVSAPALTVQPALGPVSLPPVLVAVIVDAAPDCVSVMLCDASTPAVNAAVVVSPDEPVRFDDTSTVPAKLVTVLLLTSCAVMRTANALPAVCVEIAPPPV